MNGNYIEVTFLFKDEDAFRKFVNKNCNDEYTYRKGKYIVDMTEEVKSSLQDTTPPTETSSTTSDDLPPPSPAESMF